MKHIKRLGCLVLAGLLLCGVLAAALPRQGGGFQHPLGANQAVRLPEGPVSGDGAAASLPRTDANQLDFGY